MPCYSSYMNRNEYDWYEDEREIELPDEWNIDLYLEDRALMAIDPRPWNELPTLDDWIGE